MKKYGYSTESGYSLMEMMIVIAILAVVSAGIYTTFDSGQKEYSVRQSTIRMQQQARLAMMNLEKDLKMIGYGFVDLGSLKVNVYSGGLPATWVMVDGTDNSQDVAINNRDKTDTIEFRYYDGPLDVNSDVTITTNHPESSTPTPVSSLNGFNNGDLFIIYDPNDPSKPGSMLQVTGTSSTGGMAILHNSGENGAYNPPNAGTNLFPQSPPYTNAGYSPGCKVLNLGQGKFKKVRYFIDGNFNLVKQTQDDPSRANANHVVAGGIEDLQIKYQLKGDPVWYNYGQTGIPDIGNLRAVRVSIVVRAQNIDRSFNSATVYQLTGDNGNGESHSGGGFRRMIMSTIIYLRNMGMRG